MWFSVFKSIVDPELKVAIESDWPTLVQRLEANTHKFPSIFLEDPADAVIKKMQSAAKQKMPFWSPIRLKDGKKRSGNATVEDVWCLCLDIEAEKGDTETVFDSDMVLDLWGDWCGWLHTTLSSREGQPRYRYVLPLARAVDPAEFKKLWAWAEARCKSGGLRLDPQTKDPRRPWLLPYPAHPDYQSWDVEGPLLDPSLILSNAMASEASGAPVVSETPIDAVVVYLEDGQVDPGSWAKNVKVGAAVKCFCPLVPEEGRNTTSAWMRKFAAGTLLCCKADHHGHDGPLKYWFPNDQKGVTKPGMEKGLLQKLEWLTNKKGDRIGLKPSKQNLLIILEGDSRVADQMEWDEFSECVTLDGEPATDDSVFRLQAWVEFVYGIAYGGEDFWKAVTVAAKLRPVNPLLDELNALEWDGKPRLDHWLTICVHCEDTRLNRLLGRKWLVQAVARAFEPGCKADTVLVLVGDQGHGKSTLLEMLAGGTRWFGDTQLKIEHRSVYDVIARSWIYELAELAAIRKVDVEEVKNFITSKVDKFTPMYGRLPIERRRHCVFCATTNAPEFLVDETGNRRFWPVEDRGDVDLAWMRENRNQLMAEAVHAYKHLKDTGETWWLDKVDEPALEAAQEQFQSAHPWAGPIGAHLARGSFVAITTSTILTEVLEIPTERQTRGHQTTVGNILRKQLGWTPIQRTFGGLRDRWYFRPGIDMEEAMEEMERMHGERD